MFSYSLSAFLFCGGATPIVVVGLEGSRDQTQGLHMPGFLSGLELDSGPGFFLRPQGHFWELCGLPVFPNGTGVSPHADIACYRHSEWSPPAVNSQTTVSPPVVSPLPEINPPVARAPIVGLRAVLGLGSREFVPPLCPILGALQSLCPPYLLPALSPSSGFTGCRERNWGPMQAFAGQHHPGHRLRGCR